MFNKCHLIWKWTTRKTIFQHNSCIGVYGKYLQVNRRKIKRWSIYWGRQSSIGNTWAPVKIRCIADYCKAKACSIGVVPSMWLLLHHTDDCWSWVTVEYISVQEEDPKMDQTNYVLRKVKLKLNLQNQQISIRNTGEIHEIGQNSKNKHFF